MAEIPLTVEEVVARLRVGRRTFEGWLATDLNRPIDDRRFQFHVRHGRRRLWTAERFKALEAAIERESEPGGVLAGSRSSSVTVSGTSMAPFAPADVRSACDEVLDWLRRPKPTTWAKAKSDPSKRMTRAV